MMEMREKVKIDKIKIGERHRSDMGNLEALKDSIKELGLLHPPVVNENNELVAGYRRIKACKELGWEEIPVNVVPIKDIVRGEFDENEVRKDFTAREKVAIAKEVLPEEQKKAKERQEELGRSHGEDPSEKFTEGGEAKEKAARKVGWSRPTLDKAIEIEEAIEEDPDKYGDLEKRMESSVHSAHKELKRRKDVEERKEKLEDAPEMKNLMLGDCLEKVEEIPDNSVHLLLTDPPYGIGEETGARHQTVEIRGDWGYSGDDESVFPLLRRLFEKVKPKLTDDAHIYIFTSWKAWHQLYPIVSEFFEVKNWLVYLHYLATGGDLYRYRTAASSLMFAVNGGKRKIKEHKWNFFDEREHSAEEMNRHPAQKSVSICRKLIENSTVEGETVLDPFAGSGSALVAAEDLNRNWIGIEIEKKWYDIAKSRIAEVRNG